jgi:hypothetical protein
MQPFDFVCLVAPRTAPSSPPISTRINSLLSLSRSRFRARARHTPSGPRKQGEMAA